MMVLTFAGQSVAAVNIPCSMPSDNDPSMMSMDGMDHSAHAMHELADSDQPGADCCEDDACSMGSCIGSPSMGITTDIQSNPSYTSVLHAEYTASYLNPTPLSLFRPPIAR